MPEYSAIYEDAIDRIQASYNTCSVAEQKMMRQILEEMAATGYSYTLEQIWLSDFSAIPVGVDQFLNEILFPTLPPCRSMKMLSSKPDAPSMYHLASSVSLRSSPSPESCRLVTVNSPYPFATLFSPNSLGVKYRTRSTG